jgi:hypothetical protein
MEERHDLVAKIFELKNKHYFINEMKIMDEIAKRFQKPEDEEGKYIFLLKPPRLFLF